MELEKILEFRNLKNPHAKNLGIQVEEIRPGYARVSKTIRPEDLNPMGFAHGGIYFSMADNASGTAMASHGYLAVTVNASYNFMRSAKLGDLLTAEAHEIKSGRTICVFDVQVKDQNGTLLGTGTFTFYSTGQKIEF